MSIVEQFHFKSGSFLTGLHKEHFRLLKKELRRRVYKSGEIIFQMETLPKGLYYIRKGKVKIFHTNAEGDRQIVYIYSKGETFGYRPILCDGLHPVSAQALDEVVVSFIPKRVFMKVLQVSTELSNVLLRNLSYEFSVWTNKLTFFAQKSLKARVALSLLIIGEKFKKSGSNKPATIRLSREDLAAFVGTSVEPLVRILRVLKDAKLILTKGRAIYIISPEGLEQIASD